MNLDDSRCLPVNRSKPRSRGDEPMGEEVELAATDKTPLTRG